MKVQKLVVFLFCSNIFKYIEFVWVVFNLFIIVVGGLIMNNFVIKKMVFFGDVFYYNIEIKVCLFFVWYVLLILNMEFILMQFCLRNKYIMDRLSYQCFRRKVSNFEYFVVMINDLVIFFKFFGDIL